jgi:hypothetical protein
MERCTRYWEELSVMGVTTLLFLRVEMKKTKHLQSLDKRKCYGIKDSNMLERRAFKY